MPVKHFWEALYGAMAACLLIGIIFLMGGTAWGFLWIAGGIALGWFARTCHKASQAEMAELDRRGVPK